MLRARIGQPGCRNFAYCSAVSSSQMPPFPLRIFSWNSCRPVRFNVKLPHLAISHIFRSSGNVPGLGSAARLHGPRIFGAWGSGRA